MATRVDGRSGDSSGGGGTPGSRVHINNQTVTDKAAPKNILTYTVPVGKTLSLNKVVVTTAREGAYTVDIDGSPIPGSGRTNGMQMTVPFVWDPDYTVNAGETVNIIYTQTFGPDSDIEAYLMGTQS